MTDSKLNVQNPKLLIPSDQQPSIRPYNRATVWLVLAVALLVLVLWGLGTPAGVDGKLNAIGYAICHRIPERSFHFNGEPLPLCARCTGIYLGVMLGLFISLATGRARASELPPPRVLVVFGVFVVIMAVDGFNSYLHLFPGYVGPYEPQNWLRLIVGSLAGTVMIHFIHPVFNKATWAYPEPTRTVNSLVELAGILVVIMLANLLILAESPVALLVFGLISTAGPVVVLAMVGSILFVSATGRENTVLAWRGLIVPALAGLALAFAAIGSIDAVRFVLTGTWEGFSLSAFLGG